jgi:DNA adenine methylase
LSYPGKKKGEVLEELKKIFMEAKKKFSKSRLFDVFSGSGNLSLAASEIFDKIYASDVNQDIINFYQVLKEEGSSFIDYAEQFFADKYATREGYQKLKDIFNKLSLNTPEERRKRAAILLYLNKYSFGNILRFTKDQKFRNTFDPTTTKAKGFPRKNLEQALSKVISIDFKHGDYRDMLKRAKPGDTVYFDPPYINAQDIDASDIYSRKNFFSLEDHKKLATLAKELAAKGMIVVISNHDTPLVREIYDGAEFRTIGQRRYLGQRKIAKELIATFHPTNV